MKKNDVPEKNQHHLFTGLLTVLPVLLTGYVLYWLGKTTETALGSVIRVLLPDRFYIPGIGVIVGVTIIFVVGILMMNRYIQKLLRTLDVLLKKIPGIKTIYGGLRGITESLSQAEFQNRWIRTISKWFTCP